MKIIQESWKIWFRKGMLKNHSNTYIIQPSQVKYGSYSIAVLSITECPFVAVMEDIEDIFYQVFAADQNRNLLSFLWWENGDTSEQPQNYHINYALQRTARDNE